MPLDFDSAEAHLVLQRIFAGFQHYSIQLGLLGRPELHPGSIQLDCRAALTVHHGISFQLEFWNGDAYAGAGSGILNMHPALDRRAAMIQMQVIVVNELLRHIHKRHIPGESAVVKPIRIHGGNAVSLPGIVYRNHREVLPGMQEFGDFAIEWSEAAFVLAYLTFR